MSQLSPFVRAFRTLARNLQTQAEASTKPDVLELLERLTWALDATAVDLEQQIAADCARFGRCKCPDPANGGWASNCPVHGEGGSRSAEVK